ncbi:MAG: FAD-binding oxidoreductase, partial [Tepidisphaeraceae bacterium]
CQPLVAPGQSDLHVTDMTATFAADLTLGAAQVELDRHGQWLPIDGDPSWPLGKLVECNSTGPLRLGYGAWRDLLLGVQFRNGLGELVTAGGRTMKNVAGYDLTKFMVGQHGIFGSIVTLTTRTYRRPAAALWVEFPPHVEEARSILQAQARPQWALLSKERLVCGYLGDAPFLEWVKANAAGHMTESSVDEDIRMRAESWRGNFRITLPPTKIADFVSQANPVSWTADPAFGVILCRADLSEREKFFSAVSRVGGSATLCDDQGRLVAMITDPSTRALLNRLKGAFDPDGTLAPLVLA